MPISDQTEAQDRTITVSGLRVHYRAWGRVSDPPVVLLHGYLCHARMFDSLARSLSEHLRVLAVDQRGHGKTAWPLSTGRRSPGGPGVGGRCARAGAPEPAGVLIWRRRRVHLCCSPSEQSPAAVLSETGGAAATPSPQFLAELRGWLGVPILVDAPTEVERALREVIPRANGEALGEFVGAGLRQQADVAGPVGGIRSCCRREWPRRRSSCGERCRTWPARRYWFVARTVGVCHSTWPNGSSRRCRTGNWRTSRIPATSIGSRTQPVPETIIREFLLRGAGHVGHSLRVMS